MFNPLAKKTMKIRFTKGDFSSPVVGNVWEGREVVLKPEQAKRFIDLGYAVEVDTKAELKAKAKEEAEAKAKEEAEAKAKDKNKTSKK